MEQAEPATETAAPTASDVQVPADRKTALSPESYSEEGWKVIAIAQGVLGDQQNAAVLILQKDDPALRLGNDNLGANVLDTNPRKVVFLHEARSVWIKGDEVQGWLPPEHSTDTPCLADPLQDGTFAIENRTLVIGLHYWLSCGSYGVTHRTFRFRPEGARMRLIGYDRTEFSRSSGIGEETSVNFLTGRKKHTTGIVVIDPEEGDEVPEEKESWSKISRKRWYLDSLDETLCRDWDNQPDWC
ncbi:MAG: hypothetical protein KDE61_06535 [Novosphingobium sp.]|nr:hypothetical protein [Novosphingobium sp.]